MFTKCAINTFFDNSVTAYVPQMWANESLMILEENMVAANLVHRDFSPIVADYGDTVNTRRPASFISIRKTANDDVTDQDATATNVPVVLNQLAHVSFVIRDAQASLAFKDLVAEFLRPAMIAQAKLVDQVILSQYAQFLGNAVGGLGSLSSSNVKDRMLLSRQVMNTNLAPENTRNLLWTSVSETAALANELFISAQQVGDGGNALKNATLGRKLGFDNYMSQNVPVVSAAATDVITGASTADYAAGTTALTVDGFTGTVVANDWVKIDGQPYRVVSKTDDTGNLVGIVIPAPGLRFSILNNAVISGYQAGAVNLAAGYAAGYVGSIALDGFTNFPAVGQMITFGTSTTSAIYVIVQTTSTTVTLDRPLEAALADDATAHPGPEGSYNFGFHRNAIALVSRPLAMPPSGIGANGAVVNYNNVSMRCLLSYDGKKEGTRVTLSMIFGVKVLDTDLGVVMLG